MHHGAEYDRSFNRCNNRNYCSCDHTADHRTGNDCSRNKRSSGTHRSAHHSPPYHRASGYDSTCRHRSPCQQ